MNKDDELIKQICDIGHRINSLSMKMHFFTEEIFFMIFELNERIENLKNKYPDLFEK
ncbi:MAG: hypothetical protein ACD_79C01515G0003 [uncultured bacterium]|nr:MAG: hypothetical protein ACD_79C01515G0003 [uncultured bacterium]